MCAQKLWKVSSRFELQLQEAASDSLWDCPVFRFCRSKFKSVTNSPNTVATQLLCGGGAERTASSPKSPLLDLECVRRRSQSLISHLHLDFFPLDYHEETKRQDSRPYHQHPHLPGGRSGRLRDPGVETGEKSKEEARRQKVRTHAQI